MQKIKLKVIFISGPSGSGKTTLSNQIILNIKNGIVLSTDNYYKTGFISRFISKNVEGYFDKKISFNYNLLKKDFNYIIENGISIHKRSYDFKKKTIKCFLTKITNIKFLIVEGIFAKEFSSILYNQNYFFLELKIDKNECMKRVVQRDLIERGKQKKQAEDDFMKSWEIYYKKFKDKNSNNSKNRFIITKKTNIDHIIKKIFD